METEKRVFLLSALSGAIGGAFGALSGSNSWVVVAIVSASFALIAVWGLKGLFR